MWFSKGEEQKASPQGELHAISIRMSHSLSHALS